MNISKEVKVGILGIIGIALLYFGFNFLKGSDIFSSTKKYNLTFKDVMGLEVSNTVKYNGVAIGRVSEVNPNYEADNVNVVIEVDDDVLVTNNSYIVLSDDGLIGGKMLILKISPGEILESGQELKTSVENGLIGSVMESVNPTLKNVDSLINNLNSVVKDFQNTGVALNTLLANATQATTSVNGIMASNSKNLNAITSNAAVLTADLNKIVKDLDSQLKPILANATSITDSLKVMELASTMNNVNATVAQLQQIVAEINNGKGTIGKLTADEALYNNLAKTTESLNALLVDFKASPKRYVHFSVFGKKDKSKSNEEEEIVIELENKN